MEKKGSSTRAAMGEPTRREFLKRGSAAALGASLVGKEGGGAPEPGKSSGSAPSIRILRGPGRSQNFTSRRPATAERRFTSPAVEATIQQISADILLQ